MPKAFDAPCIVRTEDLRQRVLLLEEAKARAQQLLCEPIYPLNLMSAASFSY